MNVALALILENDRVLVGKIKPEKVADYGGLAYVFPCESVQDESSAETDLVKEVKRQTNLDITVIRKFGERVHPSTGNYTYYFHCEKKPDQMITLAKDIDVESFVWVAISELENYMPTLFSEAKNYLAESTNLYS